MTTHNEFNTYTVTAADDLSAQSSRFKVISFGGTIAPGPSRAAGILQTSCRSGEQATYAYDGICKAVAGGTVTTLGFPLTVANSGFLIASVVSGVAHGRALEAAASGDLFQVMIGFASPFQFTGV